MDDKAEVVDQFSFKNVIMSFIKKTEPSKLNRRWDSPEEMIQLRFDIYGVLNPMRIVYAKIKSEIC